MLISPPAIPSTLIVYTSSMAFIDVISGLNLGMPNFAPTNAEIIPGRLKRFGVSLDEIQAWLRANLQAPAHLLIAALPEYGENHEIEFEEVIDGEAFRAARTANAQASQVLPVPVGPAIRILRWCSAQRQVSRSAT